MSIRALTHWTAGLLAATVLISCSDDSSTTPTPVTLTDLANQLSRIQSGVIVQDPTQASADDLRKSIGFIMTREGFPSESPPSAVAASTPESPHGRILDAMRRPEPLDLLQAAGIAAAPRPPLGTTCDWNADPAVNFWKLDPDNRLGPPPGDGVRFELYQTSGDRPVLPLQPIGSFIDVRPINQGTQALDVVVTAGPANTTDVLFNYELEGTSTPDLINLFMSGVISNAAGTLDFFFALDAVRGQSGGTVEDLTIENTIGVDFSGLANSNVIIEKVNNKTLEYDYDFNTETRAITAGEVLFGGEQVATVSGTQSAPIFTLVGDILDSQARSELTSILINADVITGRITDFFLLAHCIGSERPEECERL